MRLLKIVTIILLYIVSSFICVNLSYAKTVYLKECNVNATDKVGYESKVCAANLVAMAVEMRVPLIGLAAVTAHWTSLWGAASVGRNNFKICPALATKSSTPYSYTDEDIKLLLKIQNPRKTPTISDITDKYDKICVQWGNDTSSGQWIAYGNCTSFMHGLKSCAFHPQNIQQLLCVRVSSTCPCLMNIQKGQTNPPSYKHNSNGGVAFDDQGNPRLENDAEYYKTLAIHCRYNRNTQVPFLPNLNANSILDNSCKDMRGVARATNVWSGGVAQCIDGTMRNIFEKPLSNGSNSTPRTFFQKFQDSVKSTVILILILYISIIGYNILFGNVSLTKTSVFTMFLKFSVVYYFAVGDAWKDYFFNAILAVFYGIAAIIMQASVADSVIGDKCDFMSSTYRVEAPPGATSATCMDGAQAKAITVCVANNKIAPSGKCRICSDGTILDLDTDRCSNGSTPNTSISTVYICNKGLPIPRPNYENPFIPVAYTQYTPDGTTKSAYIGACLDNNGDIANNVRCNSLVDGYSANQLTAMGFPANSISQVLENGNVITSFNTIRPEYRAVAPCKTGFSPPCSIPAAIMYDAEHKNAPGTSMNMLDWTVPSIGPQTGYSDFASQSKEEVNRVKRIQTLEQIRATVNRETRLYPQVPIPGTSRVRNMDWVGVFDTLDCKIASYIGFGVGKKSPGIATVMTTMIIVPGLGIVIFVLGLVFVLAIIMLCIRVVHIYLQSIMGLVILLYISPIIVPMHLFEKTKYMVTKWIDKIQTYVLYPAFLFLFIGIMIQIFDLTFYGVSPYLHSMFNSDGSLNSGCWPGDIANAPIMCILKKMESYGVKNILGLHIPIMYADYGKVLLALLMRFLEAIVLFFIALEVVSGLEGVIGSIVGGSVEVKSGFQAKDANAYAAKAGRAAASGAKGTYDRLKRGGDARRMDAAAKE